MDKFLVYSLIFLLVLLVIFLLPTGLKVADTWSAARTDMLMTGTFALCGGGMGFIGMLAALVVIVVRAMDKRSDQQSQPPAPSYPPYPEIVSMSGGRGYTELDFLRAEKMKLDMQKQALAIEAQRRALLPQPPQPQQEDPWYAAGGDFQVIDGITAAGWTDDGRGDW